MNHRGVTALLVSGALTIAACGDNPGEGSVIGQPAAAAGVDPVSGWQEYYDLTHPAFEQGARAVPSDPVSAWGVYYDLTHPGYGAGRDAAGVDPVSAWQVYYDLTHPD